NTHVDALRDLFADAGSTPAGSTPSRPDFSEVRAVLRSWRSVRPGPHRNGNGTVRRERGGGPARGTLTVRAASPPQADTRRNPSVRPGEAVAAGGAPLPDRRRIGPGAIPLCHWGNRGQAAPCSSPGRRYVDPRWRPAPLERPRATPRDPGPSCD